MATTSCYCNNVGSFRMNLKNKKEATIINSKSPNEISDAVMTFK